MFLSGRRVDGLDQRLSQQDSANRAILEQLMKIQQDFKVRSYFTSCYYYQLERNMMLEMNISFQCNIIVIIGN